jgi:hypothetical protein
MKNLAHIVIASLAAILIFALAGFGIGGFDMLFYWASAFDKGLSLYWPAAGLLSLVIPTLTATLSFLFVFHRLRRGRWLSRRPN